LLLLAEEAGLQSCTLHRPPTFKDFKELVDGTLEHDIEVTRHPILGPDQLRPSPAVGRIVTDSVLFTRHNYQN